MTTIRFHSQLSAHLREFQHSIVLAEIESGEDAAKVRSDVHVEGKVDLTDGREESVDAGRT